MENVQIYVTLLYFCLYLFLAQAAAQLKERRLTAWTFFAKMTGGDAGKKSHVTFSNFLGGLQKLTANAAYNAANKGAAETITKNAMATFKAIDTNADGIISKQEHAAFFQSYGIPVKFSPDVFNVIDTNGDGEINEAEFVYAYVDFIMGEDESSPFSTFFGPLVQCEYCFKE